MTLDKTKCLLVIVLTLMSSHSYARYQTQQDSAPKAISAPAVKTIRDAVPKSEPLSEHGNPSHYNVSGQLYEVRQTSHGYDQIGRASWYGTKFHGELTSNRENYDMYSMTAASKTLPIPTYVRVKNLENGKSVVVRVNDRGPFVEDRILDLSYAAATKLGMIGNGTALVRVTALTSPYVVNEDSSKITERLGRFLQIGTFRNQYNALKQIAKASKYTPYPLRVRTSKGSTGQVYHVEVGPFDKLHNLIEVKQLLKSRGITPVFARLG